MKNFKEQFRFVKDAEFYKILFSSVLLLSFAMFILSFIIGGGRSIQLGFFFEDMTDLFADFINCVGYSASRDPYNCTIFTGLCEKSYPPLCFMIFYPFSRLVEMDIYNSKGYFLGMNEDYLVTYSIFLFYITNCILIFLLIFNNIKGDKFSKLFLSLPLFFSGPLLYALERGNIIIISFLCVTYFIFYYDSDYQYEKEISIVLLSVAVGIKLSPAILVMLFVKKKDFKSILKLFIYSVFFVFIPFLFFKGGFQNITFWIINIKLASDNYKFTGGCRVINFLVRYGLEKSNSTVIISSVTTIMLCTVLLFLSLIFKEKWKYVLCSVLIMIIGPGISAYYNLLYLIPVVIIFLNENKHKYIDIFYLTMFIVILFVFQMPFVDKFDYLNALMIIIFMIIIEGILLLIKKKRIKK